MAMYIKGQSECTICGRVIGLEEEHVSFPAFLKRTHRLHKYSDGVFHRSCFEASPDREDVERLYSRFREIWSTRPKDLKTKEEMDAWGKAAFNEFE